MLSIAYTITRDLERSLASIEEQRQKILLAPITPKHLRAMQWDATVARIQGIFAADGVRVSTGVITTALTTPNPRLTKQETDIVGYQTALRQIAEDWPGNPSDVTILTLEKLVELLFAARTRPPTLESARDLASTLDYIQAQRDRPIIQAALILAQFLTISPLSEKTTHLAFLVAYIFLFKEGYDCQNLVSLEDIRRKNPSAFREFLDAFASGQTSTPWLEFFCKSFLTHLEEIGGKLTALSQFPTTKRLFDLTDRQKKILTLVENPTASIRNRTVQKVYKVSQVTASRDLSRLAALGYLFVRGRGRASHYTRI